MGNCEPFGAKQVECWREHFRDVIRNYGSEGANALLAQLFQDAGFPLNDNYWCLWDRKSVIREVYLFNGSFIPLWELIERWRRLFRESVIPNCGLEGTFEVLAGLLLEASFYADHERYRS